MPCVPAWQRTLLEKAASPPAAFWLETSLVHHLIHPAAAKTLPGGCFRAASAFCHSDPNNLACLLSDVMEAEEEITSQGPEGKTSASWSYIYFLTLPQPWGDPPETSFRGGVLKYTKSFAR